MCLDRCSKDVLGGGHGFLELSSLEMILLDRM